MMQQDCFIAMKKLVTLTTPCAKIMLTMNLWPSVGLCNGATGTVEHFIYQNNHHPPDLPIAFIVKFDNSIPHIF